MKRESRTLRSRQLLIDESDIGVIVIPQRFLDMTMEVSRKFQQPAAALRCWCAQEAEAARISTLVVPAPGAANPESHSGLGAGYCTGLFGNLEMFTIEDNKRGARFI